MKCIISERSVMVDWAMFRLLSRVAGDASSEKNLQLAGATRLRRLAFSRTSVYKGTRERKEVSVERWPQGRAHPEWSVASVRRSCHFAPDQLGIR